MGGPPWHAGNDQLSVLSPQLGAHSGRLACQQVKSYPATSAGAALMINQAACDGKKQTTGWKLESGKLIAPPTPGQPAQCLDGAAKGGGPTGQSTNGMVSCPPPTTKCGDRVCPGCGNLFTNCSSAKGTWTHDSVTKVLQWALAPDAAEAAVGVPPSAKPKCLNAHPSSPVGGF